MGTNNRESGIKGELLACEYLKNKGYKLIKPHGFTSKFGQIDIIAKDGDDLVFVEVKSRESSTYGMPYEAVNAEKRRKIILTARYFITVNKLFDTNIRFDIVSILRDNITHFENAFDANGR